MLVSGNYVPASWRKISVSSRIKRRRDPALGCASPHHKSRERRDTLFSLLACSFFSLFLSSSVFLFLSPFQRAAVISLYFFFLFSSRLLCHARPRSRYPVLPRRCPSPTHNSGPRRRYNRQIAKRGRPESPRIYICRLVTIASAPVAFAPVFSFPSYRSPPFHSDSAEQL